MYTSIEQLVQHFIHVSPDRDIYSTLADDYPATARANMMGTDTSDPDAEGVAIYTDPQNLPTAIASILNHTQNRANYHPAYQNGAELGNAFARFITEIDANPFFATQKMSVYENSFDSSDYNVLIDQIVALYEGLSQTDRDYLKASIADMGKSIFGSGDAEAWMNLFAMSTLNIEDPGNPYFLIYNTKLHMKHEGGKSEVNEQHYEIREMKYFILPDLIKQHASSLAALDKMFVDEWIAESTSPERKNASLCFDLSPAP